MSIYENRLELIYKTLKEMPKDICLIINSYASYPIVPFSRELMMRNYTKYVTAIFVDRCELTTLKPKDCKNRKNLRKSTINQRNNIIQYHIFDDIKYDMQIDNFISVKICTGNDRIGQNPNLFYVDEVRDKDLEDFILIN
jgi:hypothetical protein